MIRALIADDESLSRRALRQMLDRHADVEVVAECRDGAEARDAMRELEPDVAFLDIRMPLESGLELARSADDRGGTFVVFVTAYENFALPAFEADAADYLTKPLTEARFDQALARVRERTQLKRDAQRAAQVSHLTTRVGLTDVVIPLDAIDYIEADDVYAAVMSRGKRHLVRASLDALEERLDPGTFVRIHRSYIVRVERVTALKRSSSGSMTVALSHGFELPVSRRRRAQVRAVIQSRAAAKNLLCQTRRSD